MVGGDTTASGGSHHGSTVGTFEVCFDSFIIAAITETKIMGKLRSIYKLRRIVLYVPQNHAAHFQAFHAQQIDCFLALIGET